MFFSLLASIVAGSQLPFNRLQAGKPAGVHQAPMMSTPNIALPPSDKQNSPSNPTGEVIISDVIGKDRMINIFASFTRDIEAISKRLDDNTQNTTVLAPLNSEMQKLPRKPWEDPKDYGALGQSAYEGADGEDRAHRNLRRFVEAHIVPVSPWKEGEKIQTLGGTNIWWESKGGKKKVGNISSCALNLADPLCELDPTWRYRSQQRRQQSREWRSLDTEGCRQLRMMVMGTNHDRRTWWQAFELGIGFGA